MHMRPAFYISTNVKLQTLTKLVGEEGAYVEVRIQGVSRIRIRYYDNPAGPKPIKENIQRL